MKCLMMKLIWYLPTWGQKCPSKELQPILFGKFDLGHPVFLARTMFGLLGQVLKPKFFFAIRSKIAKSTMYLFGPAFGK